MKKIICMAVVGAALVAGCESDADKVSKNISTEAEQFKTNRKIVGINGITDKILFEVEGRCSIDDAPSVGALAVTCKQGPEKYRKHYIGRADNVTYVSTQIEPSKVNPYRTKVIIKPQNIVPDYDLVTGTRP